MYRPTQWETPSIFTAMYSPGLKRSVVASLGRSSDLIDISYSEYGPSTSRYMCEILPFSWNSRRRAYGRHICGDRRCESIILASRVMDAYGRSTDARTSESGVSTISPFITDHLQGGSWALGEFNGREYLRGENTLRSNSSA